MISGDLSHVGRKLGDPDPASSLFEKIRSFDRDFLAFAARGDGEGMLELMKQDYVPYRMCGFSPLYTALLALEGIQGRITSYELWDEREGESAVTYGSLLFRSIREGRR